MINKNNYIYLATTIYDVTCDNQSLSTIIFIKPHYRDKKDEAQGDNK